MVWCSHDKDETCSRCHVGKSRAPTDMGDYCISALRGLLASWDIFTQCVCLSIAMSIADCQQIGAPDTHPDSGDGCKLFIYNLAKEVTDYELQPLFAPYYPKYVTVALGKKGTSRVRRVSLSTCLPKSGDRPEECLCLRVLAHYRAFNPFYMFQRFAFALFPNQYLAEAAQVALQVGMEEIVPCG